MNTVSTDIDILRKIGLSAQSLVRLCLAPLTLCCAYPCAAEPAAIGETVTTTFSAPAEYCVLGIELNPDISKWMLRFNLDIPERYHFKSGDIFVTFSHPNEPGKLWFSSGEIPDVPGYAPATWHEYAQQGPVAYFSGKLNPITPINVISRPTDLSSLSGGTVSISYGIRETDSSTIADSYSEMTTSIPNRSFDLPVKNINLIGDYDLYCFVVTGVKKTTTCGSRCTISPF